MGYNKSQASGYSSNCTSCNIEEKKKTNSFFDLRPPSSLLGYIHLLNKSALFHLSHCVLNCVVLLDGFNVQALQLHHRFHMSLERVQLPEPAN
jgi:hypothetical protein